MMEEEWLNCNDPTVLATFLDGNGSARKLRLFACACCRAVSKMLVPETLAAIEVAERFADGLVSSDERKRARAASFHAPWHEDDAFAHQRGPAKAAVTAALARNPVEAAHRASSMGGPEDEKANAKILREILGNPFRPVTFDPEWRSSTVMQLAQGIYDERDFSTLPILADALQDAGCDCDDILNHFRDPNATHVRGCWALDLVLGKE